MAKTNKQANKSTVSNSRDFHALVSVIKWRQNRMHWKQKGKTAGEGLNGKA